MDTPKPEAEVSPAITKPEDCKSMSQKFVDTMINQTSDVQFVFEGENGIVKVPSRKAVLAASSSVFNAMFNGDLKEKGDIEIVDASPEAFEEFLQLFYGQVKLTMNNIADVLKLVDKYNVADCLPACADFLKQNLTIDDILWGLHLAMKFHLNGLKEICEMEMAKNYKKVFDMINFVEGDNGELCNSSKLRLSQTELESILPYVFAIAKNTISTLFKRDIFPITLSSEQYAPTNVNKNETILFSLDAKLFLTDIFCSKASPGKSFDMFIDEKLDLFKWDYERIYTTKIELCGKETRVKLPNSIAIKPNYIYAITFRMDSHSWVVSSKSMIPDSAVELAPGVNISFPQKSPYKHSLIFKLYFTNTTEN